MLSDELNKLSENYQEKEFVHKISKQSFLNYLDEVTEAIKHLPDEFDAPEGHEGLLIYLALRHKSYSMEDAGEFNRQLQGTKLIFDQSIEFIKSNRKDIGEPGW